MDSHRPFICSVAYFQSLILFPLEPRDNFLNKIILNTGALYPVGNHQAIRHKAYSIQNVIFQRQKIRESTWFGYWLQNTGISIPRKPSDLWRTKTTNTGICRISPCRKFAFRWQLWALLIRRFEICGFKQKRKTQLILGYFRKSNII